MERDEGRETGKDSGLSKDKKHHKFSDFSEEAPKLEGEKIGIEKIFDKEILVSDYKISDSRYKDGTYATIQFTCKGKKCITFTASRVLQDQLKRYSGNMPFYTTIVRRGRYYTFS